MSLSSINLARWSGLAAMAGGTLLTAGALLTALVPVQSTYYPYGIYTPLLLMVHNLLFSLAMALFVAELLILHTRQEAHLGRLGKTAMVITCAALVPVAVSLVAAIAAGLWPRPAAMALPLTFFPTVPEAYFLIVGLVLIGVSGIQMNALPRWVILLLALGLLGVRGFFFGGPGHLNTVLLAAFGLGWVLLGYVLRSERAPAS